MWWCVCDCGKEKSVWSHSLLCGSTRSCGCLQKEVAISRNFKHGRSNTRLCRIFQCMKTRCYNKNFPEYKSYGGKGIRICDEWLNDQAKFYEWAEANGYDDSLTIDRIDVCGDYEPDNCRWVDRFVQANNKSTNIRLDFRGETHTMAEWARIMQIPYQTLKCRITKYGWSVDKALETPVLKDRTQFSVK